MLPPNTRQEMLRELILAVPLLFAAQEAVGAAKKPVQPARRELRRRTLTISDANAHSVAEIHVAGGVPTTLVFEIPVKENGALLADVSKNFFPPQLTDNAILLVPRADVAPKRLVTLTVTLSDGTVLPFRLVSAPKEADIQVDVALALEKHAAPGSASALRAALTQVRSELDECQANAGKAGIAKVASLILGQDLDKPQSFTVSQYRAHHLDKQNRLLVEVSRVYRLFELTYVVVTLENRDPSRVWVLDHPEIAVTGQPQTSDVKVLLHASEFTALQPGETEKVVVVFNTPKQDVQHRFNVSLLEKNGNRHVRLEDLNL
jgi:uncharacterized protein (TIGR02268 family)